MDTKAILAKLQALPLGEGPALLRTLADVWEQDPKLLQQLATNDYASVLQAVVKADPKMLPKLLALGVHLFT